MILPNAEGRVLRACVPRQPVAWPEDTRFATKIDPMIRRLCSLLAFLMLSGCAGTGALFPDQASRNQFDTWLQLQGEARRGERIDLFGKPETDLRARLQR